MLPKTTHDQRARFYEDVESLLSPGFLTHSVMASGVRFQMRSLNDGDLFMLRARTANASAWEWRCWAVATSIWMINGRSVLGQDHAVPFLADYIRKLPLNVVDILFTQLLGLWMRVGIAIDDAQVYCFETTSRYAWKSNAASNFVKYGVPGAENLGPNAVQRIWVAYNEMEDRKRDDETRWEGFKLVASSNAPKAITKMDKRDKQRREDEFNQREKDLDHFYYKKLRVVSDTGEILAGGGSQRIQGPKTVEDLEDEMRRWVTGDADLHDAVVNDYKDRIRQKHEQQRRQREQYRLRLQQKRDEMGWEGADFKPQPLVALTAEQLQATLRQRQGGPAGVAFIHQAPQEERVFRKYVKAPDAGGLHVVDGKVVDPKSQSQTDQRTLNELIKGRNPAFGEG